MMAQFVADGKIRLDDRWLVMPAVAILVTLEILTLLVRLPGSVSFLLIPLYAAACATGALALAAWAVVLWKRRRLRRAASVLMALLLPVVLWPAISWGADLIHLGVTVELEVGQIGATEIHDGDLEVHDWSTGLVGGPLTFLIFDPRDQLNRSPDKPGPSEADFLTGCAGNVRRLMGHYYVCEL